MNEKQEGNKGHQILGKKRLENSKPTLIPCGEIWISFKYWDYNKDIHTNLWNYSRKLSNQSSHSSRRIYNLHISLYIFNMLRTINVHIYGSDFNQHIFNMWKTINPAYLQPTYQHLYSQYKLYYLLGQITNLENKKINK